MAQDHPKNLATCLALSVLTLGSGVAEAQSTQPAKADAASSTDSDSIKIQGIPALSLVYSRITGAEFDGRHTQHFDGQHIAFLPNLSWGLGIRPSVGALVQHVLPNISVSSSLAFEYSKYGAISYNVGNSWYNHEDAKYYDLGLEFRGILELGRLRPFVGIAPGYAWLKLPDGVTVIDSNNSVSWSDVTLKGITLGASVGLLYQFFSFLAADASVGCRLHGFTSSTSGSLGSYGYSPGWVVTVGAEGTI